jgi:hypothetical protein
MYSYGVCVLDWSLLWQLLVVAVMGIGQIVVIRAVGRWAVSSAADQISEIRKSAQSQQEHYQASLDLANAQQRISLAFEMLQDFQKPVYCFGRVLRPAEAVEDLGQLIFDGTFDDAKALVDIFYDKSRTLTDDEMKGVQRTVGAAIVANNFFSRTQVMFEAGLLDQKLIQTLGWLALQGFPVVERLDLPNMNIDAYRAFAKHIKARPR